MKYSNLLTILVVSYDGYSDLWNDFFKCKQYNWPDCPFETVLANNIKAYEKYNVKVINCGEYSQWSTRTRIALQKIKSKYVLFMLEDFFISSKVKTENILQALSLMEKEELLYYKLQTFSKINTPFFKNDKNLNIIPYDLKYGISLLAAIWDRNFFIQKVGTDDYNPWKFEADRNAECGQNAIDGAKVKYVFDNRNILNICHMVVQGKFIPWSIKEMKRKGFEIDTSYRSILGVKDGLIYRFKLLGAPLARSNPFIWRFLNLIGVRTVEEKHRNQ